MVRRTSHLACLLGVDVGQENSNERHFRCRGQTKGLTSSLGHLRRRWLRSLDASSRSVESYLDEEEEEGGSKGKDGAPEDEASTSPPAPAKSKARDRAARSKKSVQSGKGHWALRSLNEVEATAMGVEIRSHSVKAAIIDVKTGNFLSRGASLKLDACDGDNIKRALRRLQKEFGWDGPVGCSITLAVARSLSVGGTSFTNVGNDVGKILKTFLPHNPLVTMVHTEAAGYAELSFDSSLRKYLEEDELVLVCTIGRNLGAVLYKGGHRMRNIGLNRAITKTFEQNLGKLEKKYQDVWIRVQNSTYLLPPLPGMETNKSSSQWPKTSDQGKADDKTSSQWPRKETVQVSSQKRSESWLDWVQLVDSYLIQLADYVKPTCIILMPTGAYTSGPLVETMMSELSVQNQAASVSEVIPVSSAVGALVKGAAVGAIVELKVQEAIATLRQAIGQDIVQLSNLTEEQLRAAFDYFDEDGDGIVTEDKLKNGLQALGTSLSPDLIEEKLSRINSSTKGKVTFAEFMRWWNTTFNESPVTFITSQAEFKDILDDPFPTKSDSKDSPVILQVGFSFCRPCKRFEPKYEGYAAEHEEIRFVRMNGNENEDTIQFCKEELQVRKTPSFFIFQNGKQVLSWTGANEDAFKGNISKMLERVQQNTT